MVPATFNALVIILLAIAPGYLAIHAWNRGKTWQGFGTDLDTVLKSLAASLLIQVPMFPLAIWAGLYPDLQRVNQHLAPLFLWLLVTVLILPVFGGFLGSALLERFAGRVDPELAELSWPKYFITRLARADPPTTWDWFFLTQIPDGSAVIITMNDGSVLAGSWEDRAVAKTSPNPPGIFLPEEWELDDDGDLKALRANSGGVLIPDASIIKHIRVVIW